MIIVFGVSMTYVLMRTNELSHYKVIIAYPLSCVFLTEDKTFSIP